MVPLEFSSEAGNQEHKSNIFIKFLDIDLIEGEDKSFAVFTELDAVSLKVYC